jgi:quinone-modifying oxidoreductase subunit QmoC
MNTKSSSRPAVQGLDFGWRVGGRVTTVMRDLSFDLAFDGANSDFLRPYRRDRAGIEACLQCGVCTATCDLAGDSARFPRRQIDFVRLGLEDQLAADPDLWHCYACTDCTARCPSGVDPAAIMSALRHYSTEHYSVPRSVARVVTRPASFWVSYVVAAGILAAVIAATGRFSPPSGTLRYAGMLPDHVLIPLFCVVTVLPVLAMTVSVEKAWKAWHGSSLRALRPRAFLHALWSSTGEILAHRKMATCNQSRVRPWAHGALLYGFLGLAGVSGVLALLMILHTQYPLTMDNPLKVLGNVFAASLVAGVFYFLVARLADAARGRTAVFFDWAFVSNLLLVAVSGVATEALRVANVRLAAYPVYFVHLVVVFVLFATFPYTKLSHAVFRLLSVTGDHYQSLVRGGRFAEARQHAKRRARGVGAAPPSLAAAEGLVDLGHDQLALYSDAEISAVYYRLRDEAEVRDGVRYYPNIKRLVGTAFEREKDRREVRARLRQPETPEWQAWYEEAADKPCTWWVENQLSARHALTICISCGMCTSVCPAAEHNQDYDPRVIVDVALSGDEEQLVTLLKSDFLWYCYQCGSCNSRCPVENDIMGLVTSLRCLAQLKGYHVESVRGRQQYAARHIWGANLWNRAFSLYFRNADPNEHPDFGPRYERWQAELEEQFVRVGASPDMEGNFGGRKVAPETLAELRSCLHAGGALVLWDKVEQHAASDAAARDLDLDQYYDKVRKEG